MDALEFLKEQSRMCKSYTGCGGCPLERGNCGFSTSTLVEKCEIIVTTVEKWSKEHPRKTRQSVFLKQWPNAKICVDGVLDFCPQELDTHYSCKSTDIEMRCQSCRREFWMQEVE